MQESGSNRYELIKAVKEQNLFNQMVYSGVISLNIATWFDVYERYLFLFTTNNKSNAVLHTADYFNLTDRTVYRIISYMESK